MVLEGGTLTSSAGIVIAASTAPFAGWGTRVVGGDRFVGTLLGPEGTGRPLVGCVGISVQGRSASHTAVCPLWGVSGPVGSGGRWLVGR